MKIKCVKCGWANEVNPAALLGQGKSSAKAKAARENGKLGGRPKKPKRANRHWLRCLVGVTGNKIHK